MARRPAAFSERVAQAVGGARAGQLATFQEAVALAAEEYVASSPFAADTRDVAQAVNRIAAQFQRMAIRNPEIYSCTPLSIGQAIGFCVTTGLLPGGTKAQVDLIPRKDKHQGNALVLNTQVSWRGYVALAARAGRRVKANLVFDGEVFEHEEGLDERLAHLPDPALDGYWTWKPLRAVYVVVKDAHNPLDKDFIVLYRKGIEQRRAMSQSDKFWGTWPMEMALKTGIRYAYDRGMLLLDEVGEWAMAQDRDTEHVIDAADVRTKRPAAMPETRQVADHDPLGMNQAGDFAGVDPTEDERQKVAELRGVDDTADAKVRVDPSVRDGVQPPKERESTYTAQGDAEAMLEGLGGYGKWLTPKSEPDMLKGLKDGLQRDRITPSSRLQAALDYGVAHLRWRVQKGHYLPPAPTGSEVNGG